MAETIYRSERDSVKTEKLYPAVCAAATQGLIEFIKASQGNLVLLPLTGGADYAANPVFVMSVLALTGSTTEIIVAGKGQLVIQDSFDNVMSALTENTSAALVDEWLIADEPAIAEIANRIAAASVVARRTNYNEDPTL